MEASSKATVRVNRTAAPLPRPVAVLCWLLAAAALAGTVWLLATVPIGAGGNEGDWEQVGRRIEGRLGGGELVLVHRAGRISEARPLAGLPLLCDERHRASRVDKQRSSGLWIVGDEKLDGKLRELLHRLPERGTIRFGEAFIHHAWDTGKKKNQQKKGKR